MEWLKSSDAEIFRLINIQWSNPFLDRVLPFLSSNPVLGPALFVLGFALLWKGGARGRLFVFFSLLVLAVGDSVIVNSLKHYFGRPRPVLMFTDGHFLVGHGTSASMPSGHTANWFGAATVAFLFYRRTLGFMLPGAVIVGFSRIYLGAHYLSDVIAGAILGISYGLALPWFVDLGWQCVGRRWFPLWWASVPSLLFLPSQAQKEAASQVDAEPANTALMHQHWLRLGFGLIAVLLVARLGYLASGTIELSEDEAYQWLWSKHLDLSYYSKPPMIAYLQFLGTTLWGDNVFGVRFFSPVIAAVLSLAWLQFLARERNILAGVWLILITSTTPVLAAGATLMTIDPPSALFWTLAVISGWRAIQQPTISPWLLTGLWMGLGFLSKYVALFQILCWAVFFALWKPARQQLRRPGPYLALVVVALCSLPVLIWNSQHGWITVTHLGERGGLNRSWQPTLRYLRDFVLSESLLLNPIFFIATIWAAVGFWKRCREDRLLVFLFSMGAPLVLFYGLYTLRAQVQPNWIAPAVVPLFVLMILYWQSGFTASYGFSGVRPPSGAATLQLEAELEPSRAAKRADMAAPEDGRTPLNAHTETNEARKPTAGELPIVPRRWLTAGVVAGACVVGILHNTNLVRTLTEHSLPAERDPLRRVRSWKATAELVDKARKELAREGKPVFVIGNHYGITGLLSFYIPEAKAGVPHHPLVYYESNRTPDNQFYFWPGYENRKGENAVYVRETKSPRPVPDHLREQFADVQDLGLHDVTYRGRVFHRIQLFACRGLR